MITLKIATKNAEFQTLHALQSNRKKRNKGGFIVEGVRNINNAIKYGWKIKSFIYSSEKELSGWAKDILQNSNATTHYDLSSNLLRELSNKEETSELLAVAEIPKDDIRTISLKENFLVVIFDRPSSPGNLGTIIRTSDAFGVDGLIITGHAVDAYDPETISASTGSLFALPIVRISSIEDLMLWITNIKREYPDMQIVGTDENGENSIYKHDFKKPTILLVGNEKWGLSAGFKEIVDHMVKIPMQGSASSLNVAVATGIVISEINRQR